MALKKYLTLKLQELEKENCALQFYLRHHASITSAEDFIIKNPEFQHILSNSFTPLSEELAFWMNAPYERNTNYPEALNVKGLSGTILRSKSESIIDTFLFTNKIPFRYEAPLILDGTIIHPDFTIRHPVTGKTYYWEHFGMMDIPSYSKNACNKLQTYISNGLIPSINLITTYETSKHPLNPEAVEKLVHYYFL